MKKLLILLPLLALISCGSETPVEKVDPVIITDPVGKVDPTPVSEFTRLARVVSLVNDTAKLYFEPVQNASHYCVVENDIEDSGLYIYGVNESCDALTYEEALNKTYDISDMTVISIAAYVNGIKKTYYNVWLKPSMNVITTCADLDTSGILMSDLDCYGIDYNHVAENVMINGNGYTIKTNRKLYSTFEDSQLSNLKVVNTGTVAPVVAYYVRDSTLDNIDVIGTVVGESGFAKAIHDSLVIESSYIGYVMEGHACFAHSSTNSKYIKLTVDCELHTNLGSLGFSYLNNVEIANSVVKGVIKGGSFGSFAETIIDSTIYLTMCFEESGRGFAQIERITNTSFQLVIDNNKFGYIPNVLSLTSENIPAIVYNGFDFEQNWTKGFPSPELY